MIISCCLSISYAIQKNGFISCILKLHLAVCLEVLSTSHRSISQRKVQF